jgi:hypothetical protein
MSNYRDRLNAIMQTQELKGLVKYGALLENGTVSLVESVDHALEEIVDLAYYLMHVKTLLEEIQEDANKYRHAKVFIDSVGRFNELFLNKEPGSMPIPVISFKHFIEITHKADAYDKILERSNNETRDNG